MAYPQARSYALLVARRTYTQAGGGSDAVCVVAPICRDLVRGLRDTVDAVARSGPFLRASQGFSLAQTAEFVDTILDGGGVQNVALHGDRVIGWCDVVRQPFDGMRHCGALGIGVLEEHRGQGVGGALMGATLAAARDAGISRIELEVLAPNEVAIALYRQFGFDVEGVKRGARILDGRATDIVCMALLH